MRRALARWFSDVPVADPIERRLAPLLIAVLSLTPLAAVQAALIVFTAPSLDGRTIVRLFVNLMIGVGGAAGLVLVRRGRFRAAVVSASMMIMLASAVATTALGVYEHRSQLTVILIPLAFLGLLLERRWLVLGASFAIGTAIVSALVDPGFFPSKTAYPRNPLVLVVSSFSIVVLALAVLFDRFSVTMRGALARALTRECELDDARQSLEARTADLVRVNDEMQREMTERRRLEEELLQAQKMESIGRLAGGVAHDFNNLLTVIMGCAESLLARFRAGDPGHDEGVEILNAAARGADLTQQLLSFARRQTLQTQQFDVNALVLQTERLLRRVIGTHVELETRPAPAPLFVKADPSQIQQVLVNLAANARDAMQHGGRLSIAIDEAMIETGSCVRIDVTDTGDGIDPAFVPHVFDPFFTTKEVGRGTGLGLATCFGIVSQHDGRITVESQLGRGTTVRVLLPRVDPSDVVPLDVTPAVQSLPGGSEVILVVEDEPQLRQLAVRVLRGQGYSVLEASGGEEALRLASEQRPGTLDLVVTDMLMPRMRGSEVASRVRQLHPDVKVLVVSGYTDAADAAPSGRQLELPLLAKPFKPGALARRVREVLDE
jgi:signal transduction histidine kinase